MEQDERTTPVELKCSVCGNLDHFELPTSGFEARARGVKWQQAFPGIDHRRIIQMTKHVCPGCQEVK